MVEKQNEDKDESRVSPERSEVDYSDSSSDDKPIQPGERKNAGEYNI